MAEFSGGEIVDVAINGVRIKPYEVGETEHVRIIDEHGIPYPMPPQAAITRVAPAEWPPRAGDLWRDVFGDLWFGNERYDSDKDVLYVSLRCSIDKPVQTWGDGIQSEINKEYGPLTLVHREDQAEVTQ